MQRRQQAAEAEKAKQAEVPALPDGALAERLDAVLVNSSKSTSCVVEHLTVHVRRARLKRHDPLIPFLGLAHGLPQFTQQNAKHQIHCCLVANRVTSGRASDCLSGMHPLL